MSITLIKITTEQEELAVDWMSTAFPGSMWTDTLTPQQTYRVIQNHYVGGWAQFLTDIQPCTCH